MNRFVFDSLSLIEKPFVVVGGAAASSLNEKNTNFFSLQKGSKIAL